MSTAMVIASRELRDRTRVLIVGIALAALPFLIAYVAGARDRVSNVGLIGGVTAVSYAICLAAIYGVTTIGRDLTDKRLSFYFAKPVSPAALWFGKMLAAWVTIAGAAIFIAIPSFLFARQEFLYTWGSDPWLIWKIGATIAVVFFFGGHAISTMVRSRSALVALDALLATGLLLAIIRIVRPLVFAGAEGHIRTITLAVTAALVLIFAIAPVWQLERGRADARRNHIELSRVLWSSIAVVVAIVAAYVFWLRSGSLKDLDVIDNATQASTGAWTLISGYDGTREFPAAFLVNETTGESERMTMPVWWGAQLTRDGKMLSWLEPDETFFWKPSGLRLMTRRLEPGSQPVAMPMDVAFASWYTLSPDGSRVAIAVARRLTVYETATGKILGSAEGIEARFLRALYFAAPDIVRVVEAGRSRQHARLAELDLTTKKLTVGGEMDVPMGFQILGMSGDASTMLLQHDMAIVDARTGATKLTLPIDGKKESAGMLSDGTVVAAGGRLLRHFDASGNVLATVALPVERARVVAQIGDSRVVLYGAGTTTIVDLKNRRVETSQKGKPAVGWSHDPRLARYGDGVKVRIL
jgi:ABC-type transport system involved in multi-copper enzyme maturation permease subunit